jgi:transketolase
VEGLPGIRVASGSLGQGLSVSIGAALAKKANQDKHLVYTLTGDGELEEGQNWEAIMFAGAKHVDNLIVTVDYNKKQIDGSTDAVMNLGNLRAKFEAFQWLVLDMNGNDIKSCLHTLKLAKTLAGNQKPIVILMKTEMGQGVDFMMGTHKWHGTPPNDEQAAAALAQLPETLGDY